MTNHSRPFDIRPVGTFERTELDTKKVELLYRDERLLAIDYVSKTIYVLTENIEVFQKPKLVLL